MKQECYKRRILLAVTGLTPQIVTETLYALAVAQKPAWIPTEVHLITTREGEERARLTLLHAKDGWFHRLRADCKLPEIVFNSDCIHVLEDMDGTPLADIRTPDDNTRAADFITTRVCELTRDADSMLHVSIAGGRKTMGFYLGYALSLYGRPQDRLSHVLVNQPFEGHKDFFYPSLHSELIHTPPPNSRPYDKQNAEVTLADIPFVRMRDGLSEELLEGKTSFSNAVSAAQKALPPLHLELDTENCKLTADGETFTLKPAEFACYWMMAERALRGEPGFGRQDEAMRANFLKYYGQVAGTYSGRYENAEERLKIDENEPLSSLEALTRYFDERKSRIKRTLQAQLGQRRAEPYLITRLEQASGQSRFGLKLPPSAIHVIPSAKR